MYYYLFVSTTGEFARSKYLQTGAAVFWIFLGCYMVTWGGHYTTGDGAFKVAWAKALMSNGASIDPVTSVPYSKYGIGQSLLAIPPLAAANAIRALVGIHCEAALYTFLFLVNGALFLCLVAVYLREWYTWQRIWPTLIILGFATTWWPYTKLDCSEPLVLTFVFAGFLLVRRERVDAGIAIASFSILIKVDAVPLIGVLCLWQIWRRPSMSTVVRLAADLLPVAAAVALTNYIRFHSILTGGYQSESFDNPLLVGIYGMLFSAGKSLFLFTPPLVLGFCGLRRFMRRDSRAYEDGLLFILIFCSQLLFYAKWWDWSGDDGWGVRFMIPAVMLMTIPCIELLEWRKTVVALSLAGICIQLLAVVVSGLDLVLIVHEGRMMRRAMYIRNYPGDSHIDLDDMRFNPRYSQIAGHWTLIRALLGVPPASNTSRDERVGTFIYDTLPPAAWTEGRSWDFIWLHLRQRTP